MLEVRKVTKAIIPLSKLGAMYGRSLLETVKDKFRTVVYYTVSTTRGALPWEGDQQQLEKSKELSKIGEMCDDCKSQSLLDQFKSILERRRLRKCMEERYYRHQCQEVETELFQNNKSYPYFHASTKDNLPGGPIPGWQELNKQDRYKNLPCC